MLPEERSRRARLLALAAGAGLVVLSLWALRSVLVAIGIALFIAYVCHPLVRLGERHGVPRALSAGAIVVAWVGVFTALALGLVPLLQTQVAALFEWLPIAVEQARVEWLPWIERTFDIRLPQTTQELLAEASMRADQLQVGDVLRGFLTRVFRSTADFLISLFQLSLVPVLAFYALVDGPRLGQAALALLPPENRAHVRTTARRIDEVVATYLRGQLIVAAILGVLFAAGWSAVGVPFGILVGLLTGLLGLVPYLGPAVGLGLALLLSFLEQGLGAQLLWVLGVFAGVQLLEATVITPRIVGESLGLHPVVVILGLVAGGQLLGLVGILLAVPALAVVRVLAWPWVEARRRGAAPPAEATAPAFDTQDVD